MQPIVSGSTTERVVRTSIVTALAIFAAAYCFYDGYVGYPRENLRRALKDLSPQPEQPPPIVQGLTSSAAEGDLRSTSLADLKARWGEPGWRHENELRWFGPGGQLVVTLRDDYVVRSEFVASRYKTELDLVVQKIMGIVIGIAAVGLIVHWLRVVFTRTTLTDEGVKVGGNPFVPFDAITGLRAEHFAKKGWLDVDYSMNGRTGTFRLDDYKIKAFPTIIDEICRRKGFEDPYKKWRAEKAANSIAQP